MSMDLAWQPSLFDGPGVTVRPHADFAGLRRHELGAGAWVDVAPRWCDGADALFARRGHLGIHCRTAGDKARLAFLHEQIVVPVGMDFRLAVLVADGVDDLVAVMLGQHHLGIKRARGHALLHGVTQLLAADMADGLFRRQLFHGGEGCLGRLGDDGQRRQDQPGDQELAHDVSFKFFA